MTCTNPSCDGCDGLRPTPSHPSQPALEQRCGHPATHPVTRATAGAQPPYRSLVEHLASARLSAASTPTAGAGLPLLPLAVPMPTPSVYYTVTPVDARGRLADRSPIRALGWPPGQPITITVLHQGALVVTAQADGAESITRQGHLRLPARIRHACRLNTADRLLVAAAPPAGVLIVYTMALLESILLTHHTTNPSHGAAR